MASPMTFLESTSKGWDRVWGLIESKYGSKACLDERTGETWQYMGTIDGEHHFRHRSLRGQRTYDTFKVEPTDREPR